jgi:glycosyltransferase involved in cell wall biosynthesis
MGFPANKIEVVHNSCAVPACRMEPVVPIILTAGHLVPYKNPELWLEVASTVVRQRPDACFVWLGDGELLETVREKVREMSLEERVLLPGYVSDPSVWYAQAQVYFQPSLRESHGIAVLEAMSHGIPCVVSDVGGLPESVVDRETGYVCPAADYSAFVVAIIALLGDQTLRERLGSTGRQRVSEKFSEESQERKIMALYDRFINMPGGL